MDRLDDATLDELARLAGEATPGLWTARTDLDSSGEFDIELSRHGGTVFGLRGWRRDIDAAVQLIADAAYIAAANPATVAALVAEVKALRAATADAREALIYVSQFDGGRDYRGIARRCRAALDGGQ